MGMLPDELRQSAEFHQGVNGEEAVALWREHRPDLILLDLTMPVMDGFDALKLIRSEDQDTPILVVSADVQTKAVERVLAFGANGFVDKSKLEAQLREHLSRLELI